MEQSRLRELAGKLPTPCYIYDEDDFERRARIVRSAFGEKTGLCFSIKANPFLLSHLPGVFSKIEVCSPGELTICEKLDLDMKRVVFSGVNKMPQDVARAMDDGVGIFTVESFRHLELIETEAQKRDTCVPVLIRIARDSQFGMDLEDVYAILAEREQHPNVRIEGIHYFTGTQKRKPQAIIKELGYLRQILDETKEKFGFSLQKVEYGTGLSVDYFTEEADSLEMERLEAIAPAVRELAEYAELTVEMGRFFAAPCGYYVTEIADVKTNGNIHYAICDGGMNQLKYDGQLQGMQTPVITAVKRNGADTEPDKVWTLCGSLCTTADVLARTAALGDLSVGDRLVFHRTGAYSLMEGITTFLSRETAIVYLHSLDRGLRMVRQRYESNVMNLPSEERKIDL